MYLSSRLVSVTLTLFLLDDSFWEISKTLDTGIRAAYRHYFFYIIIVFLLVWEYIDTFYNTVRIHSHDNFILSNEYEHMYAETVSKNAKIAS